MTGKEVERLPSSYTRCTIFGALTSIIVKVIAIQLDETYVNIQCKVTDYFSFFSKELRCHSTSLRRNGSVMHGAYSGARRFG